MDLRIFNLHNIHLYLCNQLLKQHFMNYKWFLKHYNGKFIQNILLRFILVD